MKRIWTPEEIDTLKRMRLGGSTVSEVAIALDRPYLAIVTKSRDLRASEGFNPPKVKPGHYSPRTITKPASNAVRGPRTCLCCGKLFLSEHKCNRICLQCKETEIYGSGPNTEGGNGRQRFCSTLPAGGRTVEGAQE